MSAGVGVDLDNVWIRFGDFVAVRDANVNIEGGDFFSFLGPSGCGKTTILRAVSGFLEPSEGKVRIGGQDMAGIGPNKRPTALIFQNLALFPLMTVWENIAFALEVQGRKAAERRKRADELLELIALPDQGDKMPRAVRRPAPARGHRPGAVRGAGRAAARRAAVGAGSEAAPAHAHRAARHPAARRHHLHLHHPRPGRGPDHVGPRRGDARGRDRAGRRRTPFTTIRPRPSSPLLSARTICSAARSEIVGDHAIVATNRSGDLQARIASANLGKMQAGDEAMMFVRPESFEIAPDGAKAIISSPPRSPTKNSRATVLHLPEAWAARR